MSANPGASELAAGSALLRDVAGMLREVTGESSAWEGRITAASRLEDDLHLDSVELAALDAALRRRFGADVDLFGYLALLDLDQLIALSVGDLLGLLPAATDQAPAR